MSEIKTLQGMQAEIDELRALEIRRLSIETGLREACDRKAAENTRLKELLELYRTRCIESEVFSGTLAIHVLGFFAMPDINGTVICRKWAENVKRQNAEHEVERIAIEKEGIK